MLFISSISIKSLSCFFVFFHTRKNKQTIQRDNESSGFVMAWDEALTGREYGWLRRWGFLDLRSRPGGPLLSCILAGRESLFFFLFEMMSSRLMSREARREDMLFFLFLSAYSIIRIFHQNITSNTAIQQNSNAPPRDQYTHIWIRLCVCEWVPAWESTSFLTW
jgi:hypothetical protein